MPDDLVTVAVFDDAVRAETAKGLLRSHGLRAFVMDAHVNGLTPQLLSSAIGVRLQVPRSEAKEAVSLLEGIADGSFHYDAEEDGATGGEEEPRSRDEQQAPGGPSDHDGVFPWEGGFAGPQEPMEAAYEEAAEGRWEEESPTEKMARSVRAERHFFLLLIVAVVAVTAAALLL